MRCVWIVDVEVLRRIVRSDGGILGRNGKRETPSIRKLSCQVVISRNGHAHLAEALHKRFLFMVHSQDSFDRRDVLSEARNHRGRGSRTVT